jgi:hypothetical protein
MGRRRRRFVLAILSVVLVVAACSGDDDDDAARTTTTSSTTTSTSTTTTSTSSTTSTTAFSGSTAPTSIPSSAAATALLTDVTVEDGLVTFRFRADLPGVDVRYVEPPITQDGSGATVDLKGSAFLQVRMEPASGVDLSKDPFEETYTGPDRLPGAGPVAEVVKTGDFEANLTWVIGVDGERAYRVEADASTVRVYISR